MPNELPNLNCDEIKLTKLEVLKLQHWSVILVTFSYIPFLYLQRIQLNPLFLGRTVIDRKESGDMFAMSSGCQPVETLNENSKEFKTCHWCFDTPGVMQPEQVRNDRSIRCKITLPCSNLDSQFTNNGGAIENIPYTNDCSQRIPVETGYDIVPGWFGKS